MKEAIESSGGLPSVSVTLCGTPNNTPSTKSTLKWEGVSLVSNIEYCEEGLRIWRAYNVGPGEVDLSHPIIYDTHNICELVATDKLSVTFSVIALREICLYFDIDVTDVTAKRKKPYTEKLHRLVWSCTCHLTKAC
ncbi:hypothetical protein QZH41_008870 [Actinostola sp. cb2023]|nr:hypothetical protein QZH41_008870 [Actinostola sp. cb2023]